MPPMSWRIWRRTMAIKCKRCVHRSDRGSVSTCNYQQNTGHCKIVTVVRADGTEYKTVSPVENCAFFEPGRRQKPAVETWRLAPAVAKIDICKGSRIGQLRKRSDAMSTPYGHGGRRIICRPTGTRRRTEHYLRDLTKMVCPLGERERKGGRGDGEGEGACSDDG